MLLGDEAYLGLSDIGCVEYLGEKSYPVKNCFKLCDVYKCTCIHDIVRKVTEKVLTRWK